jgi:hypothetical protein
MTKDDFITASIAILRTSVGWHAKIAKLLECDHRRIKEWLDKGETPDWVDHKIAELIQLKGSTPWPRDEWIVGDGVSHDGKLRQYVVHTAPPRFIARVVMCGEDQLPHEHEQPVDIDTGTVYTADGFDPEYTLLLSEIEWIDQPNPGEVTHLLEAASDAIETWYEHRREDDEE